MPSIGFTVDQEVHRAFKAECARRGTTMKKALVAFMQSVANGEDRQDTYKIQLFDTQCRDCAGQGMPTKPALYCSHCGKPRSQVASMEASQT